MPKTKNKIPKLEEIMVTFDNVYYRNPNILEKNFPVPKKIETENWKLIKMDKPFSSKEALKKIKAEGCHPANIYELLLWAKDNQEKSQWVVGFGSEWIDSDGRHRVPDVHRNSDGDWKFNLGRFEGDWDDDGCLLCFCDSTLTPSPSDSSGALTRASKKMIRENLEKAKDLISEIEGML